MAGLSIRHPRYGKRGARRTHTGAQMDERIATTLWTSESDEGRALLCGAGIPFVAQAFMPAASTLVSTFGHTLCIRTLPVAARKRELRERRRLR